MRYKMKIIEIPLDTVNTIFYSCGDHRILDIIYDRNKLFTDDVNEVISYNYTDYSKCRQAVKLVVLNDELSAIETYRYKLVTQFGGVDSYINTITFPKIVTDDKTYYLIRI